MNYTDFFHIACKFIRYETYQGRSQKNFTPRPFKIFKFGPLAPSALAFLWCVHILYQRWKSGPGGGSDLHLCTKYYILQFLIKKFLWKSQRNYLTNSQLYMQVEDHKYRNQSIKNKEAMQQLISFYFKMKN